MKFYQITKNEHTKHYMTERLPDFIDFDLVKEIAFQDCDQVTEATFTDEAEARQAFANPVYKNEISAAQGYPNGTNLTATVYTLDEYEAEDLEALQDGYGEYIGGDFREEFDNLTDIPDTVIKYQWAKNEDKSQPNNGYSYETEAVEVHHDYSFGDWLNDQGVQYEQDGATYYVIKDGERTGEAFQVLK